MGSGGGSQPAAPDPYQTAQAQTDANKSAIQESYKDAAIDQYAPWGSTTYSRDANGMPIAQNTNLSPAGQQYYDTSSALTNALAGKAATLASYIPTNAFSLSGIPGVPQGLDYSSLSSINSPNLQTGYDTSGLPGIPGINDFSADRQNVTDAQYGLQTQYLDPQYAQKQNEFTQSLSDRGIVAGSDLYNNQWQNFNDQKARDYQAARDSSILSGGNEQSRLFGLQQSARNEMLGERSNLAAFGNTAQTQQFGLEQQLRNQGLSEQQVQAQMQDYAHQTASQDLQTERNQRMNEASALIQGSPSMQMPQSQGTPQFSMPTTDIGQYINQNYSQQMQGYQTQQAAKSNNVQGGAAVGTAAVGLIAL